MPWTAKDAPRKTRRAKTAKQKRQWAHIAESARKRGVPEGQAIRMASGVIKKQGRKKRGRRSTRS